MTCNNHGHWHLGISQEACGNANGKWIRSPCRTLKKCIDDRPVNGTDGYSQSFEDFALTIVIEDATIEDQSRNARSILGYDDDYEFDTDICDEFYAQMCDPLHDELDLMGDVPQANPYSSG